MAYAIDHVCQAKACAWCRSARANLNGNVGNVMNHARSKGFGDFEPVDKLSKRNRTKSEHVTTLASSNCTRKNAYISCYFSLLIIKYMYLFISTIVVLYLHKIHTSHSCLLLSEFSCQEVVRYEFLC